MISPFLDTKYVLVSSLYSYILDLLILLITAKLSSLFKTFFNLAEYTIVFSSSYFWPNNTFLSTTVIKFLDEATIFCFLSYKTYLSLNSSVDPIEYLTNEYPPAIPV